MVVGIGAGTIFSSRRLTGLAFGVGILSVGIAMLAAQRTITEGRASAKQQQELLGEQIAARVSTALDGVEEFIAHSDYGPLLSEKEELAVALERDFRRHEADGWIGVQVLDAAGGAMAESGSPGHSHHGEGHIACPECAQAHRLIMRGTRGRYQVEVALDMSVLERRVLGPVREQSFEGSVQILSAGDVVLEIGPGTDDGHMIRSTTELPHLPSLGVAITEPEGRLTGGLRWAVLTQLAATGLFAVLIVLAFLLIRQVRKRELAAEQQRLQARLAMQQRTAHMDRLASMGVMAASVAHELSSPLTYVMASIHSALQIAEETNHEELAEIMQEGNEGCERVRTILNDMRAFAHPGADGDRPLDVKDVVNSAARISRARLRGVAEIDIQMGELPMLSGNPSRLAQVFLNLFINAGDAMAGLPGERDHNIAFFSSM